MDNSFDQGEFKTQQPRSFFAGLQIFDTLEKLLAGLFELTKEEGEDAAVYFDDQGQEVVAR